VNESQDTFVLHTPRGGCALPLMRVVMGGVASRFDLPLERLDDLELAVETLLAEEPEEGGSLVLTLSFDGRAFRARLDGLTNQALYTALAAPASFRPSSLCRLDVRLFLDALVESYQVLGQTGTLFAVEMEKRAL
jgi:hypothetical protein